MRHRSGSFGLVVAFGVVLGGAAPLPAHVTVVATGLRNSHGVIRACMTAQADRFPTCSDGNASYSVVSNAAAGQITLIFPQVRPGRYAVALLHDENGNGKADRAAMMIPREGFGFSRDAKVRFGPPSFNAAAFEVGPGANDRIIIRMRYML